MAKKTDYKGKEMSELSKLLKEKKEALHGFTFNILNGKEKNVKLGRTLRKDIARIMTEITASKKAKNV